MLDVALTFENYVNHVAKACKFHVGRSVSRDVADTVCTCLQCHQERYACIASLKLSLQCDTVVSLNEEYITVLMFGKDMHGHLL